jgi:transcriptional regulator with XRE-family HTH domain
MKRHKLGDAEFALRIGKDRSLVNRLRRGEVRPTLDVAGQIEAKTNGEVPMQAWVDADHLSALQQENAA